MVRSLGADHVIDYKEEDFTKNSMNYDLILAVNGYHPISDYLRVLKPVGSVCRCRWFDASTLPGG